MTALGIIFMVLAVASLSLGLYLLFGFSKRYEKPETGQELTDRSQQKWETSTDSYRPENNSDYSNWYDPDVKDFIEKAQEQTERTPQQWYDEGCVYLRSKNDKEASRCFSRAAESGHAKAQTLYGIQYLYGRGVERDYIKGRRWLEKAARQGNVDAIYNLGVCYLYGRGVEPDKTNARKLLIYARGRGVSEATRLIEAIDNGVETEPLF